MTLSKHKTFKLLYCIALLILIVNIDNVIGIARFNVIERALVLLFVIVGYLEGRHNAITIPFVGMITVTLFTALMSKNPSFSWSIYVNGTIQFLIIYLMLSTVPSEKTRTFLLKSFCFLPIVSVVLGTVYYFAFGRPLFYTEWASGMPRLQGSLIPAFLASLCITAVYSSFHAIYRIDRRYWYLLIVNGLILVLTAARMALFLTAIIAFVTIFFGVKKNATLKVWSSIAMIFATLIFIAVFGEVLVARMENSGLNGRDVLWNYMNALSEKYKSFGIGLGHQYIMIPDKITNVTSTVAAHNEYIRLKLELGTVPFYIFISLYLGALVALINSKLCANRVELFVGFAAFMMNAFVANSFSSAYVFIMLYAFWVINLDKTQTGTTRKYSKRKLNETNLQKISVS